MTAIHRLATDTNTAQVVADQDTHDVVSLMAARLDWACDEPRDLEGWAPGVRLAESRTFARLPEELLARFSGARRAWLQTAIETAPEKIDAYRLNLYELRGADEPR